MTAAPRWATSSPSATSRRSSRPTSSPRVGIAGTAGIAVELVRLFQVELEHYEKIEGTTLSLDGKANRLSALIRGNLAMAMQGLAVVPLFAGYDLDAGLGPDLLLRRHRRPLRGDRVPLGRLGLDVRPRLAQEALPRGPRRSTGAVEVVVQALYDAADDDSATGGPDLTRRIFPVVQVITAEGGRRIPDDEVAAGRRPGDRGPDDPARRAGGPADRR